MMGIGMVLGPVVAGVLSSRDATLRLTFCAAGLLQFANALYVALAVKETHSGAASDGGWGALLRGANPLSFVRLFCHGRRLSTVTLAIGLSAFSDQEKDLKSIYRREVLQWTPAASATYLSAQGLTYFLGPQLTRPMLKALGPRRTTMYGQIAAAAEHGIRAGLIGAPSSCWTSAAGAMSEISVRQATLGVIARSFISRHRARMCSRALAEAPGRPMFAVLIPRSSIR